MRTLLVHRSQNIRLLIVAVVIPAFQRTQIVRAQNSCTMDILVFNSISTCTSQQSINTALGSTAFLKADRQCHTVETASTPPDPVYSLLSGNYRAECVNRTAMRFLESGCIY
jgi:hypothetical protein